MKDIKEAPFGEYINLYIDTIYGNTKYKGIIKCDNNNIDVFPYIVTTVGRNKEFECIINFKSILGWDYLEDDID